MVKQPLYKKYNVSISDNWFFKHNKTFEDFAEEDGQISENQLPLRTAYRDDWDERPEEERLEEIDNETLLERIDPDDVVIKMALGQGKTPLSLYSDKDAEELSFPTIFCGTARELKAKLSYGKIVKSELRRYDRRACIIPKILFSYKKEQERKISNSIRVCVRKKSSSAITAKDAKNQSFLEKMRAIDNCYSFLECERSSPAFWQKRKKDTLAMQRTLGSPAFFITLSAAETQWTPLLRSLYHILYNKTVDDNFIQKMSVRKTRHD